jgi:broad specificity phosphatase PhoE
MSRIIFVRHAETDMAGTFCGHSDPELNQRGRTQLEGLIVRLQGERFSKIFSSDLIRSRQTARAISSHFGADVEERVGLREIYFGEWEGLSWNEIESRDPELAKRWVAEYPVLPAPGGETFTDFETRVHRETEFLLEQAAELPIIAVTHAGFLRVALARLGGELQKELLGGTPGYGAVVSVESQSVAKRARRW